MNESSGRLVPRRGATADFACHLERTWSVDDKVIDVESSDYRIVLPLEMEAYLNRCGFGLVGLPTMRSSDLSGTRTGW
ncbi:MULTISPECIES: hypothetical protein [unclassified Sinorhizobium]|uniref:hypothetical protein n=1 Tax=unclassified Sinorhizobium TaxID=2613772 RepID=UPI0024C3E3CD|nr:MULTISPECIES: hypothetical protein [unclassified Sinorhizobium]MDK1378149.1 hypothetical protein [Sinorhizobium sp. 6-70]MDK1479802.1 hypothetical protein [Sinorhizobium sp. 6-117]